MSTHKNIDRVCVAVILLALIVTVLFMNGEALGIQVILDEDVEAHSDTVYFTKNDLDGAWDSANATLITLRETGAKVSGSGAYAYRGDVFITESGTYVITGTLSDGSVVVDAHKNSKVWILLNGASIYCSDNAAFRVDQADKVFLTLADGTENSIASGAAYSEDAVADNVKGALFARDDLTINGGGSLTVTAEYCHGVDANDELVITGGNVTVSAVSDALHVNDSFRLCSASLTLTAGDEGIDVDAEDGWMYMESGTLTIDAEDDGVHTEGSVTVIGGELAVEAGDDGVHTAADLSIEGGTVLIAKCTEGLEGCNIRISGGDVTVYPTDDGLNATGTAPTWFDIWSDDAASAPAESAEEEEDDPGEIRISGGTLTIVNTDGIDADGLDSNGSIYITGGDVRISLNQRGGSNALDAGTENGGVMEISGGTVVACGSYAMAESFSGSSTQCAVLYAFKAGAEGGTEVSLEDADGNVLLSYTPPCDFTCAALSCPEMELGGTYRVVVGGSAEEITLEEVSASYGDAQGSGFDGAMHWGGLQPRGDFPGSGETGERPEPPSGDASFPEMPSDGERPEMPFFEDGERPEPPDGSSFPGTPPSPTDAAEETAAPAAAAAAEEASLSYAGQTWLWLGISAAILLAGLIVARLFRKHA